MNCSPLPPTTTRLQLAPSFSFIRFFSKLKCFSESSAFLPLTGETFETSVHLATGEAGENPQPLAADRSRQKIDENCRREAAATEKKNATAFPFCPRFRFPIFALSAAAPAAGISLSRLLFLLHRCRFHSFLFLFLGRCPPSSFGRYNKVNSPSIDSGHRLADFSLPTRNEYCPPQTFPFHLTLSLVPHSTIGPFMTPRDRPKCTDDINGSA